MAEAGEITGPTISQKRLKRSPRSVETETKESILSPRFRSAAAMAGWDEEALLFATQVVEDTPVRESSRQTRSIKLKSSSLSSSNRKRRSRRKPVDPIPAVVLCLDDDDDDDEGSSHQVKMKEIVSDGFAPNKDKKGGIRGEDTSAKTNNKKVLPYMDKLREELSCAICLEICYEPSTTPCGHSFCKKCLKSAAQKCGKKCPKCRQLISNGRSCTVNTVLWNTIQLLFPEDAEEARKKAAAIESSSKEKVSSHGLELERIRRHVRSRNSHSSTNSFRSAMEILETVNDDGNVVRRLNPSQSEDAALALRLQREEFLETFRSSSGQQRNSLNTTRARLRSMAVGVYRMRNRS